MTPPFVLSAVRTPAALECGDRVLDGLADVAVIAYGSAVTFGAFVLSVTDDQLAKLGTVPAGGLPVALVLADGRRLSGHLLGGDFRVGNNTLRGAGVWGGPAPRPDQVSADTKGPFE